MSTRCGHRWRRGRSFCRPRSGLPGRKRSNRNTGGRRAIASSLTPIARSGTSWIWGFYYLADSPACRSREFRALFLRSLYLHGEFVATHLERADVNGNHYLCDGVGLVFLGAFFGATARGRKWLAVGRELVVSE